MFSVYNWQVSDTSCAENGQRHEKTVPRRIRRKNKNLRIRRSSAVIAIKRSFQCLSIQVSLDGKHRCPSRFLWRTRSCDGGCSSKQQKIPHGTLCRRQTIQPLQREKRHKTRCDSDP